MIRSLLINLIRFYQIHISFRLGRQCCFKPTCSQYAIVALGKYNIFKAIILILKRLHKCSRFYIGECSYIDYP